MFNFNVFQQDFMLMFKTLSCERISAEYILHNYCPFLSLDRHFTKAVEFHFFVTYYFFGTFFCINVDFS